MTVTGYAASDVWWACREMSSTSTTTQFYPSTVGDQGVFLMNDYRDSTADSRRFGTIPLTFTDGSVAILLRRRSW